MAGRWQIRHKLLLGLGLVVVVVGLMLAGTVQGLTSYRHSSALMESKVHEKRMADQFKVAILQLYLNDQGGDTEGAERILRDRITLAEKKLADYQAAFEETQERGRFLRKDRWTGGFIKDLARKLATLKEELEKQSAVLGFEGLPSLRDRDPFKRIIDQLAEKDIIDLEEAIYCSFDEIRSQAKVESSRSLWVVVTTAVVGVLLMAGLLRVYYGWTYNPLHDLMQGVARVARGDFEHTIQVGSGDEMEDLASAFNEMTGRLRDMYRDLERQVNERSRQLVRSERLASVGFLAAGVAHEINNPLASIAFCSEALEARLRDFFEGRSPSGRARGEDPRATVEKYLKMIQDEAFRCKEITQRLLEFSRGGERRREEVQLGELIQSVLDVTQHLQTHKGKTITFTPTGQVTAWVNAQDLKSVVLNLVVNALESMDDEGTLTVELREREGRAEMIFRDTGCGMTAEVLENIFEPFYTHSRTGKGTGLGLTISHRIVTGHGGEIAAQSQGPGKGSTFTVRLPVQPVGDVTGMRENEEAGNPEDLFRKRQAA